MSATDYALMRSSGTSGVHTLVLSLTFHAAVPPSWPCTRSSIRQERTINWQDDLIRERLVPSNHPKKTSASA